MIGSKNFSSVADFPFFLFLFPSDIYIYTHTPLRRKQLLFERSLNNSKMNSSLHLSKKCKRRDPLGAFPPRTGRLEDIYSRGAPPLRERGRVLPLLVS